MLTQYGFPSRWPSLLRDSQRAQEEVNRLLARLRVAPSVEFPAIGVWVNEEGAFLAAEIPGVNPEKVEITVHRDRVTLRGTRELEVVDGDAVVIRSERPHGPFSRVIVLPFRVDSDKASARAERGVLTLTLPRPETDKPRTIKIAPA